MERLYGSADHFITHFGFRSAKTNVWNTEVFFGGRFRLTLQVPVTINYRARQIAVVGKPCFCLNEVASVHVSDSGRVSAKYGQSVTFSEDQWQKIYKSRGDLSAVGVNMHKGGIVDFDALVTAIRRPRIPITLLNDD
jgi:hypothetical protein